MKCVIRIHVMHSFIRLLQNAINCSQRILFSPGWVGDVRFNGHDLRLFVRCVQFGFAPKKQRVFDCLSWNMLETISCAREWLVSCSADKVLERIAAGFNFTAICCQYLLAVRALQAKADATDHATCVCNALIIDLNRKLCGQSIFMANLIWTTRNARPNMLWVTQTVWL